MYHTPIPIPQNLIDSTVSTHFKRTHKEILFGLPVVRGCDFTCLFITSVDRRKIGNHNTDPADTGDGGGGALLASQRRVITPFTRVLEEYTLSLRATGSLRQTPYYHNLAHCGYVHSEHPRLFMRSPFRTYTD